MNSVEVTVEGIEAPAWLNTAAQFCAKVLDELKIDGWEVSLLLCDDGFIQELNRQYRGKNEPTDVLSFAAYADNLEKGFSSPTDYATITAGDVVVSLETLKRNSQEFNVSENEELKRLLIHGILHLTGMDHASNSPDEEMLRRQEELMKQMAGETIF